MLRLVAFLAVFLATASAALIPGLGAVSARPTSLAVPTPAFLRSGVIEMGRGDKRTKKGKRYHGSNGKARPSKNSVTQLFRDRASGARLRVGASAGGGASPDEAAAAPAAA